MKKVAEVVLEEQGQAAMQYSATDGYLPLREAIAERMNRKLYTNVEAKDILVTNGSQQCLDFMGRVFLDEGDKIIVESPSYLGAGNPPANEITSGLEANLRISRIAEPSAFSSLFANFTAILKAPPLIKNKIIYQFTSPA